MTDAEIDNHPAVVRAIEEADAIPKTNEAPGYFEKEWFDNREFVIDGVSLKGYSQGINSLIDRAKKLAYTDAKLEVPPGYKVKAEKKAVIFLGPPAAGKSTQANLIARKLGAAIIDSDDAKKALPEFQGGIGAAAVHEESSALAELVEQLIIDEGSNIVIPKVGGNQASIVKVIDRLKAKGYTVTLASMDVTPQNALTRMLKRFVKTGRLISPEYVRSIGTKPNATYASLKQQGKADGYAQIDNNQKLGESPTIREDTDGIFEGLQFRRSGDQRSTEGGEVFTDIPGQRIDGPGQEIAEQTSLVDDLDLEVPTELTVDGDSIVAKTQTLKELQEEFAQDQRMLDRLEGCVV
jgi:adenylate kinase family enzyme